ncbi:MAG: UDP-3-O-(3-hydroxymyristoyl)glucosamine N-acyltransferase [Acetobacteraceae bacterium]
MTRDADIPLGDPRFFRRTGPHTLAVIAEAAGGVVAVDDGRRLSGLAPLGLAGPNDVSYLDNRRYAGSLAATRAGAVLVAPDAAAKVPPGTAAVVCTAPGLGWIALAALFHPLPRIHAGVHPSAVVDPSARIDANAEIGPLAVVGAHAEIGAHCRIGPAAVIGEGVVLGPDCQVGAHASVSHALLGARIIIHPGARIGQEGFSLVAMPEGPHTLPQLGRVIVGDDVEIGANTTIDRGALSDTVIGAGSRLDNLVQIGHNVRIGRCCVIVAQVGISGSTVLEDFVTIGGQAATAGHLRIGAGVRIGAQAGVISDLPPGAEVLGSPAQPARAFFRQVALLRRLAAKGRNEPPGGRGTG